MFRAITIDLFGMTALVDMGNRNLFYEIIKENDKYNLYKSTIKKAKFVSNKFYKKMSTVKKKSFVCSNKDMIKLVYNKEKSLGFDIIKVISNTLPKDELFIQKKGECVLQEWKSLENSTLNVIADKKKMKERSCLTCGKIFLSEGPHNRICNAHATLRRSYNDTVFGDNDSFIYY